MRNVTVAAIQMQCAKDVETNIQTAERLVRQAAEQGAQIILLPELFERPYFCQERQYDYYQYAQSVTENTAIQHFKVIAKELKVVLPISFYEKDGNVLYNSIAVIDADGEVLGVYRKTHVMINRTGTKIHTLLITGLTIGPSTVAIQALTPSGLMKPAMLMIAPMNMIRPQGMRVWKSLGFKMPNAHSTIPPSRATMPASKKLPIHRTRQTAMTTSATHSSFFIFPSSLYLSEK